MQHPTLRRRSAPVPAASLVLALLLAACGGGGDAGDAAAEPAATADTLALAPDSAPADEAAPSPVGDPGPVADLPPNELGRILVLEYHRLGATEADEGEWVRTAEHFRQDLRALYERGYRPVTVRQMVEGDLDLPAGTTPVVFTFDDSSKGQFYFTEDGAIDPGTMVGMWDAFRRENPAWSGGATWCVLPAADHPSNFFGEAPSREVPREEREARIRRKVDWLVENGHEICNHTLYHARLDRARDDAQVQEWIGRGEDSIRVYLPEGYDVTTLALPLGLWPETRSLAWEGAYQGRPYSYDAVLEVSGGPSVSPFDARFDPRSIDRFIVAPGALERQLERWERDPSDRYVSDGDPRTVSVPRSAADRVARGRLDGRELRVLDPPAAASEEGDAAAE